MNPMDSSIRVGKHSVLFSGQAVSFPGSDVWVEFKDLSIPTQMILWKFRFVFTNDLSHPSAVRFKGFPDHGEIEMTNVPNGAQGFTEYLHVGTHPTGQKVYLNVVTTNTDFQRTIFFQFSVEEPTK